MVHLLGLTEQPGSPTTQAIAASAQSKDGDGKCSRRDSDIELPVVSSNSPLLEETVHKGIYCGNEAGATKKHVLGQ